MAAPAGDLFSGTRPTPAVTMEGPSPVFQPCFEHTVTSDLRIDFSSVPLRPEPPSRAVTLSQADRVTPLPPLTSRTVTLGVIHVEIVFSLFVSDLSILLLQGQIDLSRRVSRPIADTMC